MAIKDKNGKVYQLRGPNPIMKEQQEWDRSSLQLFNLKKSSEIIVDARNPVKEAQENIIDIGQELNLHDNDEETKTINARDFLTQIQEEPIEILPEFINVPVVEPEPVMINVDQKIARLLKDRGVEYHCAPAIGEKVHHDDLYGTSYTTTRFGTSFVFDAIIIDYSDLQLQFWCIREIGKNSIVHRKDPEGGERWWKISEREEKSDGYLYLAITSELNPDFS